MSTMKISGLNTTKVVGGILIAGVLIFIGAKIFKGGKGLVKRHRSTHNVAFFVGYLANADLILPSQVNAMMNRDYEFLEAWYNAASKDRPTFQFGGKTYNVKGGTAVS